MKTIKGDLILKKNTTFDESLTVEGNILGDFDLKVKGNLNCRDLDCRNLDCRNLDCWDLEFYAIAIAYNSFKCKSWKARRDNYIIKCLDGEIEIKGKKVCSKCGQEIK